MNTKLSIFFLGSLLLSSCAKEINNKGVEDPDRSVLFNVFGEATSDGSGSIFVGGNGNFTVPLNLTVNEPTKAQYTTNGTVTFTLEDFFRFSSYKKDGVDTNITAMKERKSKLTYEKSSDSDWVTTQLPHTEISDIYGKENGAAFYEFISTLSAGAGALSKRGNYAKTPPTISSMTMKQNAGSIGNMDTYLGGGSMSFDKKWYLSDNENNNDQKAYLVVESTFIERQPGTTEYKRISDKEKFLINSAGKRISYVREMTFTDSSNDITTLTATGNFP